ncbi:MAG: recombination protein NinG [Bacteroidota bacterium]
MESKTIQKYKNKSVSDLLGLATKYFNLYIRLRDTDEYRKGNCISSGRPLKIPSTNSHAGHLYSAGDYPLLRFNEDNVHLQSLSDNYFKSGNQLAYVKNLIKKIGSERVIQLQKLADQSKRINYKWDRFELIDIIEKYKVKSRELKKEKI